ncbi:MAG: UDP-N-acetylmuramate dehydrogenase [Firmicutes bacterium]|nr:UDP-N-acetylmuramate dehydrogenase [Bacillota bacterium]
MKDILKDYLCHLAGEENVLLNQPLSKHTSFKIGGPAKYYVNVKTKEILIKLIDALNFIEQKYFIMGFGCNVLASDNGYDGVVIRPYFKEIIVNANFIYADAGANLKLVCNAAKNNGLTGLEWACGIPSTVGGAVYMNAGAYGGEMKDVVTLVDVLVSGQIKTITATEAKFGYRTSIFHKKKNWIILGAYFYLQKGAKDDIITLEAKHAQSRNEKQPKQPSAGSVFLRPEGYFVGKLIDDCRLRGFSIGGAQISPQHAGFIVNNGGATCNDVLAVVKHIKKEVLAKFNVKLKMEIVVLK